MRIPAVLTAYQHYGVLSPSPFWFAITSEYALKQAILNNLLKSLRLYSHNGPPGVKANTAGKIAQTKDIDYSTAAIGLAYNSYWSNGDLGEGNQNLKANWTDTVGAGTYLENPTKPGFGGTVYSLLHSNSTINTASGYVSTGGLIPRNTPWAIHLFLYNQEPDQLHSLFRLKWDRWQITVTDDSADIMRLAEPDPATGVTGWTQAQETTLDTLVNQEDINSSDQASIDAIKHNIYKDYQSLSLDIPGWHNRILSLTFIPEPMGRLIIIPEGRKPTVVNHTDILLTRSIGTMWENTALTLKANAGAYEWQMGYPLFAPSGEMQLPYSFGSGEAGTFGGLVTNYLADTSMGGSVTITNSVGATTGHIITTLATPNQRYTPFLYRAYANIPAGARTGTRTSTAWTSASTSDPGTSPIKDVEPEHDGTMKRTQWRLRLRDINGLTFKNLADLVNHDVAENRVADLSINGNTVLYNGIITRAEPVGLASADDASAWEAITNPESEVIITLCDQWAILEEKDTAGEPGDNLHLGDYLIILLKDALGSTADVSGITAGSGTVLPDGAMGENFAVQPSRTTKYADWIRELVQKYAPDWWIYQKGSTGAWTFEAKQTSIKTLHGQPVAFHGRATENVSTYPGRYTVLRGLQQYRDTKDFYNYFEVTGADDAQGNQIVLSANLTDSQYNPDPLTYAYTKRFIGRVRPYRTSDTALRTKAQVAFVLRSLSTNLGQPPRYISLPTYFIDGLSVGDVITVFGVLCRIERIEGGSIQRDRMHIIARELIV